LCVISSDKGENYNTIKVLNICHRWVGIEKTFAELKKMVN